MSNSIDLRYFSLGLRYAAFWNSSKNADYRKRVHLMFSILVNFLQENNLTTRCLLPDVNNIPLDFEIKGEDLTDEGYEFCAFGIDRWFRRIDRGRSPTNISLLEKSLKEIRSKGKSTALPSIEKQKNLSKY